MNRPVSGTGVVECTLQARRARLMAVMESFQTEPCEEWTAVQVLGPE